MKKRFYLLFFIFSIIASNSFAQADVELQVIEDSYKKDDCSKVKPRYFNNKLFITTEGTDCDNDYVLHVFSLQGQKIATQTVNLENGEYIYHTNNFRNGVYVYYIVYNYTIAVRGTFTKKE